MLSGSFSPGTWTRMRLAPCRWMVGSRVPSSSIRRRTTSSDWVTAARTRSSRAESVSATVILPLGAESIANSRALRGAESRRRHDRVQIAKLAQRLFGLAGVGQGQDHLLALRAEPAIADPRLPQLEPNVAYERVELVLDERVRVDLEQEVRPSLQIEAQRDLPLGQPVGQLAEEGLAEEVRQRETHRNFAKRSVAVVAIELVGLSVVGDDKVRPAVLIVIEQGDAERFRTAVEDAAGRGDVFESAVTAIVEEPAGVCPR